MLREIRFALRSLAQSPAFTLIAIATLALAIGANTAVLSLVNALLIRPLPYRAPERLVLLLQHFKTQKLERIPVSPPEFVDYESRAQSFERLGAFGYANFNLANSDKPERIAGALVTLQTLLYRVSAFDAPTFLIVTLILGAVALAASYLPAQRATRADPMIALSHDV